MQRFLEDSKPAPSSARRVKVAVLDTGIDRSNNSIALQWDKRIRYKNCVDGPAAAEDLHGHGTHIAGTILRLAQNADLYVFRVVKKDEFNEENITSIASVSFGILFFSSPNFTLDPLNSFSTREQREWKGSRVLPSSTSSKR